MSDLIRRSDAIKALRLEYPIMPMFKKNQIEWAIKTEGYRKAEEVIMSIPTIEPKEKVIAQVTFDEEKLREIVKEAVERFKEEYEIEPKRGEWVFDEKGYFFCSECKRKPNDQYATTDFCPNCGADMKGADDE